MSDRRWQDEWKTPAVLIAIIAGVVALIVGLKKGDDSKPVLNDDPKIQIAKHYLDSLEQLLSTTRTSIHNWSDSINLHSVMLNSTDPAERAQAQREVDEDTEQLEEQQEIEKRLEDKIDEFHKSFK